MSIPTVRPSSSDSFIQLASIPLIDLRFLSQSELNSLALCSNDSFDLRRCDDVVIPKIDRSIFNESAGSRKQTYSRLRLARGPTDDVSAAAVRPHRLPHHQHLNPSDDAERSENKQIILFLRKLFVGENPGAAAPVELANGKRRRGPEAENGMTSAVVVYDNGSEMVNRNGVVVDVAALADKDDLFGPEVRRRTEGLETEAELLRYLEGLEGQWGSRRKKRKIVDAADFGDDLPRGWKILLGLKRKEGQLWLACRKYISPNGHRFESCKEVSSYLLSFMRPQDASQSISNHNDGSTLGTCTVLSRNTAGLTCKDDIITEDSICYSAVPISSVSNDYEKQIPLLKAQNLAKDQEQNLLECRKCQLTFGDKDAYVQHLLSFHRRKAKRWGLVKSISDGVIIKNGKYECQFCHKTFDEKHRYRGHVGVHAKYYVKGIGTSPNEIIAQKSIELSPLSQMPLMASEMDASMDIDADKDSLPETSTPKSSDELHDGYPPDGRDTVDTEIDDSPSSGAVEISHESKSVDKQEMCKEVTDDKLQGVVKIIDSVDVKPNARSDPVTPLSVKEENVDCEASYERNLSRSSVLDGIDKHEIEQERGPECYSVSPCNNEQTRGIESNVNDIFTNCDSDHMPNETERPGNEMEHGLESCSMTISNNGQTCDIDTYMSGIFTGSGKETVFNETEKSTAEPENGFGRSHPGLDKATVMEIFGSMDEDDVMQNAEIDTSLSIRPSDCFLSLDMASDKREDEFSSDGQKHEKMSGYEELRLDAIEPQKYGLVTDQDSSSLPQAPIDLAYCAEFQEGLNNSVDFEWDSVLPKMVGDHQLATVCVWCGMEFDNGGVDTEPQSDSVGFMCPTCKAKISGQFNVFDNGFQ